MSPPEHARTRGNAIASLTLAASLSLTMTGCSLFGSADAQGTRDWSDSAGQGLRSSPPSAAAAAEPDRKSPFWEKYRDKRVGQINEHLNVEEPAGF